MGLLRRTLARTLPQIVVPAADDRRMLHMLTGELARRHAAAPGTGDLTPYELRVTSQNGEDGVLAELVARCGAGERWFVEFGAADGRENTCAALADVMGWNGLFIEGGDLAQSLIAKYRGSPRVRTLRAMITPENVEELFTREAVPEEPTVLSIDVDGMDYWIWESIERFRPRIVAIEHNSGLPHDRALVQPREAAQEDWDGTDYVGCSLRALVLLAGRKGYRLAHVETAGVNAFFVRDDIDAGLPDPDDVVVRTPNYYLRGGRHRRDPLNRPWLDVERDELVRLSTG